MVLTDSPRRLVTNRERCLRFRPSQRHQVQPHGQIAMKLSIRAKLCIERFFRTFTEQLCWRPRFRANGDRTARSLRFRAKFARYSAAPVGRGEVWILSCLRNAWLRSRRDNLPFRSRWNRALSPLMADMLLQE